MSAGKLISLAEGKAVVSEFLERTQGLCQQVAVVGSVRRARPLVHDVDLVVELATVTPGQIARELARRKFIETLRPMASKVLKWGPGLLQFIAGTVQVDVYFADSRSYGMVKLVRTGSAQHNIWLAMRAKEKGLKFAAAAGIVRIDGDRTTLLASRTEEDIFAALGLSFVVPELRELDGRGRPMWMGIGGVV
jgi:DNA polymerase (family 10)